MDFSNKTVFITGAGGYLGSDNARKFASLGANVVVCDISKETVDKTVSQIISMGGKASGIVADVTKSREIDEAIQNR